MKRILLTLAAVMVLFCALANAQATNTANSTISVDVTPEATFTVAIPDITLTNVTGNPFGDYTGQTQITYKLRTANAGTISVQFTEFAGSGPKLADLLFASSSTVGTPVPSTVATTGSSNVITFAADKHSADSGTTDTVNWTLANRPTYKTGLYSTVATFTISVN